MAGREAHPEEEEKVEVEEPEEGEDDDNEDEEDDSCYSYSDDGDDDEGEVGDDGGRESDDFSSSNGDEAGEPEHVPMAMVKQQVPAGLKPVKTSAWPPAAPPPGFMHVRLARHLTPPVRAHIVSASLPCSWSGSPRSPSGADLVAAALQKWGRPGRRSSSNLNPQSRRRSSTRLSGRREASLRRSKSCGEGRASQPTDELDIWPKPAVSERLEEAESVMESAGERASEKSPRKPDPRGGDGFKCGAFCMFLPGFSKVKQVQPHREVSDGRVSAATAVARMSVASRAASLEKFECGSWSSSVILSGAGEDQEGIPRSYFDLPLELMMGGSNDTDSPVKAAFVFDRDRRGVLKANGRREAAAASRRWHESPSRHVTFSAASGTPPPAHASVPSSPTAFCISPRLRKAREDFNAFLEAQNA